MTRRWMTVGLALVALVAGLSGPADASSANVMKWQRRLNALHCDAGPVDGSRHLDPFGHHPVPGPPRHGPVGVVHQRDPHRLFAANAQRCDVRRLPAGSGSGRRIVISQKQNWVWIVGAEN